MLKFAREHFQRRTTNQQGQAILEFLPVAVLMLTLTFSVVDFGYFLWQSQVIVGLTREGSNLASRDTTLTGAATAVIQDATSMHLNLGTNGKVIITSVKNIGTAGKPNYVVTGQYISPGGFLDSDAPSKIGSYNAKVAQSANIPAPQAGTLPVPQPNATVFITEIYCPFNPLTPLGAFVKYAVPTKFYDVAYF